MKVIFLGTPEFGKVCLDALIKSKHEVVAVVCQEDKPSGRGNKLKAPPTKILAQENNIPVYQFHKIRTEGVEILKSLNADIMVTSAYGQILSQEIIDICPHKIINVHGSLLPKYRGASPIQSAILNGEVKTGVTIMQTEIGIDTGAMLESETVEILPADTYGTLSEKLSYVGAELLIDALDKIENGIDVWTKQDESQATFTKMIKPEQEYLDFNDTMVNLVNKVRAFNPNPVAKFKIDGEQFKVFQLKQIEDMKSQNVGEVLLSSSKKGLIISCKDGAVEVVEFQPPSSKRMLAKDYLNGKKIDIGTIVNA